MRHGTLAKGFNLIHIINEQKIIHMDQVADICQGYIKRGCHNMQSLLMLFKHNMK